MGAPQRSETPAQAFGEAGPLCRSPWVPEAASSLQMGPGRRPASALLAWLLWVLRGLLEQPEGRCLLSLTSVYG